MSDYFDYATDEAVDRDFPAVAKCLADGCQNSGTRDDGYCDFHGRRRFDIAITEGDALKVADLRDDRLRSAEANEDYFYEANCTPLTAAQQRAKELIEAELKPLMATLPVYGEAGLTW